MEEPTTIYVSCVLDSDQDQHALLSNIISQNKKINTQGEKSAKSNIGKINIQDIKWKKIDKILVVW